MENASAVCCVCNGPIGSGEPVTRYSDGAMAHRFRSTCRWHEEQEAKFLKDVGVKDPSDPDPE